MEVERWSRCALKASVSFKGKMRYDDPNKSNPFFKSASSGVPPVAIANSLKRRLLQKYFFRICDIARLRPRFVRTSPALRPRFDCLRLPSPAFARASPALRLPPPAFARASTAFARTSTAFARLRLHSPALRPRFDCLRLPSPSAYSSR